MNDGNKILITRLIVSQNLGRELPTSCEHVMSLFADRFISLFCSSGRDLITRLQRDACTMMLMRMLSTVAVSVSLISAKVKHRCRREISICV